MVAKASELCYYDVFLLLIRANKLELNFSDQLSGWIPKINNCHCITSSRNSIGTTLDSSLLALFPLSTKVPNEEMIYFAKYQPREDQKEVAVVFYGDREDWVMGVGRIMKIGHSPSPSLTILLTYCFALPNR